MILLHSCTWTNAHFLSVAVDSVVQSSMTVVANKRFSHCCVLLRGHGQREDMFHGVVFDGLDSVFTSSFVHTLYSILKALNNRKHIYAITLKNDFTTIKQQHAMLQAEKGDCFSAAVTEIMHVQ